MKKFINLHPLFFAAAPVLTLYSHNIGQVPVSEVILPLLASMTAALVLLFVLTAIWRDFTKAGIFVSLFLLLFFSHGHACDIAGHWWLGSIHIGGQKSLLLFWFILLLCCLLLLHKTRMRLVNLPKIMAFAACAMVIFSLVNISVFKIQTIGKTAHIEIPKTYKNLLPISKDKQAGPDIYYLIFDRYGSEEVLRNYFNFDNGEFTDALSKRGFQVVPHSRANYHSTAHSLAASLNMEYIHYLRDTMGDDSRDWTPLFSRLENYTVWRFLKEKGYQFIHAGPRWQPTRSNKYADININYYSISEFSSLLCRTTMLLAIYHKFEFLNPEQEKRNRILYEFEELAKIPYLNNPTYTFAHMLIPHEPYVFDKIGKYPNRDVLLNKSLDENYLEQLQFLNSKIIELVDLLLERSEQPPIIIIQGDEGPYPASCRGISYDWTHANDSELRTKFGILTAAYLPHMGSEVFYSTITPVNIFRIILNRYFDTNLELLPDEMYIFQGAQHPYKFFRVLEASD